VTVADFGSGVGIVTAAAAALAERASTNGIKSLSVSADDVVPCSCPVGVPGSSFLSHIASRGKKTFS